MAVATSLHTPPLRQERTNTFTCTATSATATSCTITGLTNRIEYSVTVVATNAIGDSTPSATAMATPVAPLTFGTASIEDRSYTVGQTVSVTLPPAAAGTGTGDLSYALTPILPPGLTFTTATRTLTGTPTMVFDPATLTYTVTDENTPPATAALTFMVRVDATVPRAPTGVSAVAGNGEITVSWTALSGIDTGGSAITTYTATAQERTNIFTCTATSATATSCIITGLTNRIEYSVTVVATNAIGDSTPSNVVMATPVAPLTFGTASIENQLYTVGKPISVAPLPPAAAGTGTGDLSYALTPILPPGLTFTTATRTLTGTPTMVFDPATLTYTVTDENTPPATAALTFMVRVDATVPRAPTGVSAVAGNGEITVSWTALSGIDTGGSAITTYTATAQERTNIFTCTATSATATSCIITGLTNRIEYSVTVVATNAIGDSTPSNVVMATPVAPLTFGTASIENQLYTVGKPISVAPLPPAAAGTGTGDLSYALTPILPPGLTFTTATRTLTGTPTMVFDPATLTYTVTDENTPPATAALTFMVRVDATVPRAPTGVSAVAGNGEITVSWTALSGIDTGGSAITTYTATATAAGVDTKTCTATSATATSCIITGLTNRIEYSVTVVATNAIGDSTPSNVVMATPVAPLTFGTASIENQLYTVGKPISVAPLPPAAAGTGTGDLSYALTPILPPGLTFTTATRTLTGTPTMVFDPATLTYTVTDENTPPATAALTFMVRVDATVPRAPTGVSAVAGNGEITVSWTALSGIDTGGSAITTYTATAQERTNIFTCTATSATATSCIITGLTNRIEYSVTVVATNAIGDSTPSATAMATPVAPLTFGTASIEDRSYTVGQTVSVTLPPAAAGTGTGDLSYALTPILPPGLTFTTATRTLTGTPTMVFDPATLTYTVTDSADSPATAALTFMVRVTAAVLFRIKVFLEGAQ